MYIFVFSISVYPPFPSCGVAYAKDVGYEYNKLLSSADEALYQSKASGRNKYTIYKQRKNNYSGYKNN